MPLLVILQAAAKIAFDAANSAAGRVVIVAALAYGLGHHRASEAYETRIAQERATLAAAHAQELAREQDAARTIAQSATERAASDALEARALQAKIDDLKAKDNLDVPPAASMPLPASAARPCVLDADFSRRLREFDAAAHHRTAKTPSRAR